MPSSVVEPPSSGSVFSRLLEIFGSVSVVSPSRLGVWIEGLVGVDCLWDVLASSSQTAKFKYLKFILFYDFLFGLGLWNG